MHAALSSTCSTGRGLSSLSLGKGHRWVLPGFHCFWVINTNTWGTLQTKPVMSIGLNENSMGTSRNQTLNIGTSNAC